MSYASVASHNAPSYAQQPKPDAGLLQTDKPAHSVGVADDAQKVNVVGPDFKSDPTTLTSEADTLGTPSDEEYDAHAGGTGEKRKQKAKKQAKNALGEAKNALGEAEKETIYLWELAKEHVLVPGVAGGLLGVVNVGLLSWASFRLYQSPALRNDSRALAYGGVATVAVLGAESALAAYWANTPEGRRERERAKKEGTAVYRHAREVIFRPGAPPVLGAVVGLLNLGLLGTLGWSVYNHWDQKWDRRVVSAVTVGLLTLWGGEGVVVEKYREHSPRR